MYCIYVLGKTPRLKNGEFESYEYFMKYRDAALIVFSHHLFLRKKFNPNLYEQ